MAGGALVLFLLSLWKSSDRPSESGGQASARSTPGIQAASDDHKLVPADSISTPEPTARVAPGSNAGHSIRGYLEEYWGDEWPEVRERLEEAGKELDRPFEIRPWEQVEGEIRSQLLFEGDAAAQQVESWIGWELELSASTLEERFEFEPPVLDWELEEMNVLAEEYNLKLRALAEACLAETNAAIEDRLNQGLFDRVPFSTASLKKSSTRGVFVSRAAGYYGWTAKVGLRREDYPRLVELRGEMRALRSERDGAILRRGRER